MEFFDQGLVFEANSAVYAIDSNRVLQILRVPEITKLPFCDGRIVGITPLEGSVIPIIDASLLIGESESISTTPDARVITILYGKERLGLLVDRVHNNIAIPQHSIELSTNSQEQAILGLYKQDGTSIQLLGIDDALKGISSLALEAKEYKSAAKNSLSQEQQGEEGGSKYLYFSISGEIFAIEADIIREVILNTEPPAKVARSPEYVKGVFTLRGDSIISIDTAALLGLAPKEANANRTVIIENNESAIGFLIDRIVDIKDVDTESIKTIPQNFQDGWLKGAIKEQNGLVSLLEEQPFLELATEVKSFRKEAHALAAGDTVASEGIECVIFMIEGKEYTFMLESIEEIIKHTETTALAGTGSRLKGIINIRGGIVPVISLHAYFGTKETIGKDTKILITNCQGQRIGFMVDRVSEIIAVAPEHFEPSKSADKAIESLIMLDGGERLVMELDPLVIANGKSIFTKEFYRSSDG